MAGKISLYMCLQKTILYLSTKKAPAKVMWFHNEN